FSRPPPPVGREIREGQSRLTANSHAIFGWKSNIKDRTSNIRENHSRVLGRARYLCYPHLAETKLRRRDYRVLCRHRSGRGTRWFNREGAPYWRGQVHH